MPQSAAAAIVWFQTAKNKNTKQSNQKTNMNKTAFCVVEFIVCMTYLTPQRYLTNERRLKGAHKKVLYFWCSGRDSRRDINWCSRLHFRNITSDLWLHIKTNGSYKKNSGLQCPLTTYQKMQLWLTLSKNTENRRNLAYVFDYQCGHLKNHDQEGALANKQNL